MGIRALSLTAPCLLFSPSSSLSPSKSPQLVSCSSLLPFSFSRIQRTAQGSRTCTCTRTRTQGFSGTRMSTAELEQSLLVKKKAAELSNGLKGTSIFLVGMNCSMKANLGKLLADALRYYYFDSDSLVEQAAGGESAAKSLRERDEKGFRDSETEVLKQLSAMGRLVVCAGDGAVRSSTNLALMRYGISIWIDVPLDMVANEVLMGEAPETLTKAAITNSESFSEVLQELSEMHSRMREGYSTADATVSVQKVATQLGYGDFDSVTPEDMAVEALKEIEKLTRAKKMMEAAARPF